MSPSPNARTKEESIAQGVETFGALNRHPISVVSSTATTQGDAIPAALSYFSESKRDRSSNASAEGSGFKVGVSVDRNKKCRRTMEDAHSFIYDFGGIRGQGYFAVFDGHAGKHAAEWCGEHFHENLLSSLRSTNQSPVPDILNSTFHSVDSQLSALAQAQGTHSGCTAVTAFLRLENANGEPVGRGSGVSEEVFRDHRAPTIAEEHRPVEGAGLVESHKLQTEEIDLKQVIAVAIEEDEASLQGEGVDREQIKPTVPSTIVNPTASLDKKEALASPSIQIPAQVIAAARRTLYTANVGDARAVLSRGGKAIRLTYDHKGSDAQEAKRITDAGGFVMNNRVNGVLAVTRALGDSSMKQFVVGSPYTTETTLGVDDEWLIVACDGLWDVCEDQEAVDIINQTQGPQEASRALLDHALQNFSSDNLSVLVVSLRSEV